MGVVSLIKRQHPAGFGVLSEVEHSGGTKMSDYI
jgi:hypothetical protein